MRFRILRVLIGKEIQRLALSRGAITMAVVLVAAALLSVLAGSGRPAHAGRAQLRNCWVDYWADDSWLKHLRSNLPSELQGLVQFRPAKEIPVDRGGTLQYGYNEGAIQLRSDGRRYKVWFWYPGADPGALSAIERWFWLESERYFHEQAIASAPVGQRVLVANLSPPLLGGDSARIAEELHRRYRDQLKSIAPDVPPIPEIEVERTSLHAIEISEALIIALILFGVFFVCVCLMPSLTAEERERGVLLAQLLSPASSAEILVSKGLVFGPGAALLAGVLAGICRPAALSDPLLWAAIVIAAAGFFSVGTAISVLARTQRAASLAAMGYALVVALVVFAAQRSGYATAAHAFLECQLPPLILAGLNGASTGAQWLACAWAATVATLGLAFGAGLALALRWAE